MSSPLPQPWLDFLTAVDASLREPVEIHCVGGFVLTVVYGVPRTTGDIDYIASVPDDLSSALDEIGGRGSQLARKHRVFLQRVSGITDLPEDYESRLAAIPTELKNLSLRVLDPCDLCLSKLTRNSPKDREDVKALATKLQLSFAELYKRFEEEMKPWLPNLERHELTLKLWREYFRP